MKENKKEPNGYMIRSNKTLNEKLSVLKRMLGCGSFAELINTMLKCPSMTAYLYDKYKTTAFEFTPKQKQAYEKEHNVEPSGSYRVLIVPKNVEVVKK